MTDAGNDEDGPRLRLAAPEHQPEWLNGNAARTIAARETARVMALFRSKPFASMFKTTDDAVPSAERLRNLKTRLQGAYLEKVERIDEQLAALRAQLEDASVSETRKSVIPSHIESTKKMLDEEDARVRATSADLDEVAEAVERLPANIEAAAREVRKRRALHERRLANDPHYGIECVEEAMTFLQERAAASRRAPIACDTETSWRGTIQYLTHMHKIGAVGCDTSVPATIVREPEAYKRVTPTEYDVGSRIGRFIEHRSQSIGSEWVQAGHVFQASFPNLRRRRGVCTFFKPEGCVCYYFVGSEHGTHEQSMSQAWAADPTFTEEFIRDSCACDSYQRRVANSYADDQQLLCASLQVTLSALKRCLPPPSAFNLADDATTVPNDDDDATSDSSDRKRARQSVSVSQQMSAA